MHLSLSEEEQEIQRIARAFSRDVLLPKAADRDVTSEFPEVELKALAETGFLGVAVPESLGGSEAGTVAYSLVMRELAWADASVAVAVSVTNMVAEVVAAFGSEEQKQTHFPELVDGSYLCGAFALSEPQAGSDAAAMQTRATKIDGGWRIDGAKQWITSGDRAGLMVVWAVTDRESAHKGISAFLVRAGAKGLGVAKAEEKMGLHGSTTVQLTFDGVEVGDGDILGSPGDGFKIAMMALDGGRIGIASQALGISSFALDEATRYSLDREQFGRPIARHQAIENMLADCATWLDAGTLLTLHAADRKARGLSFSQHASMAKLFATEKASLICDHAIQIHGGYGYTRDFPVERAYRDARVSRIYEGTSEIQRIVIARNIIKDASERA